MAKTCPACQAENRDDAQFCRICGVPFPLIPAAPAEAPSTEGVTCNECGFANRPGVRYCAKCGVNLMGTVVVPRSQRMQAPAPPPSPTYAPPQWSPPPEPPSTTYPAALDPLPLPDVPDPRLEIDLQRDREVDPEATVIRPPSAIGFGAPPPPLPPRRTGLWAALAVALVVAGGVAWYFLASSPPAPAPSPPAVPVQPVEPAASVPDAASSAATSAPPAEAPPSTPASAATAPATSASPASAPPLAAPAPAVAASAGAATADDERLAAERRARLARERAERDARAKAEREQAAARQRSEQEAARRAEEEQRQRVAPAPALPTTTKPMAAPSAYGRTVADICGGRSLIARSMCESRECGAPEHANEALCQRVRENEERHRDRMN